MIAAAASSRLPVFLDVMDRSAAERTRRLLQQALAAIDAKAKPGTA